MPSRASAGQAGDEVERLLAALVDEAADGQARDAVAAALARACLGRDEPVELAPALHACLRRRPAPGAEPAPALVERLVGEVLDAVDDLLAAGGLERDVLVAARGAELDDPAAHARLARALQAGR